MKLSARGATVAVAFFAALLGLTACSAGATGTGTGHKSDIIADGQTSTELNAKEVAKRVNRPITVILSGQTGTCIAEPGSTLEHNNYDDWKATSKRPAYVGVFYQAPDTTFKAPVQKSAKPTKASKAELCSNFHGQDLSGHTGHVKKSVFDALVEDTTAT